MPWKKKSLKNKNPYMEETVESSGIHGNKSEARLLDDLGADPTIGSGAFDGHKSDGLKSVGDVALRIECKSTRNKSISLKYDWFKKIREEALETDRVPVLTISFVRGDGTPKPAGDWVCIPAHLFKEICDETPNP